VSTLPETTSVLVAGGGPVGLAAAVELGQRGVDTLVIEPRATVSHARPRCKTFNVRTMEHLRRWGLADRVRERCPLPTSWSQDIVFCTSLAGHELSRFEGVLGLVAEGDRFAEIGQQGPQYVLEEVLREAVEEIDACQLVLGARVEGLRQTPDDVTVAVRTADDELVDVKAGYALGCEGARSVVREAIGSGYEGRDAARPNVGMMFRAPDLWDRVAVGRGVHYHIVNPRAGGLMGPIDLEGTWWIICFGVTAERAEQDGEQIVTAAIGAPVPIEILSRDPWSSRMQLVDRAHAGRVCLAGDAAHLNPPHGGHGLNTGIGDAVDLGWKIAAILDGWADPQLLASYEAERRPLQERIIAEATENMQVLGPELVVPDLGADTPAGMQARRRVDERIQQSKRQQFHALDLVLDWNYELAQIVQEARSGGRCPHTSLSGGRSLYDQFGDGLTLVRLDGSEQETASIREAAARRGAPLTVVDLTRERLSERYGASLMLIRPDQHIAWLGEAPPAEADALIDRVCGAVVSVA
jgi:2-polyprenyl-6-methoxyphenol hydroxylase-like FAD-dependent oxidoreductase